MRYWMLFVLLLLTGCAQLPEATGEIAQAVSSATQATAAGTVDSIVNNDINIPLNYVLLIALIAWCVRTPWGLVADFITGIRYKLGKLN